MKLVPQARSDRTATRRKTKGGTDRGAALVRARLSVRSALSHPTQTTVQFDVRGRTTTTSVRKVGLRMDLLREQGSEACFAYNKNFGRIAQRPLVMTGFGERAELQE
jgi:hypothetical protein